LNISSGSLKRILKIISSTVCEAKCVEPGETREGSDFESKTLSTGARNIQ
jgi:hypothetical protein